jgi:hypothetical protein
MFVVVALAGVNLALKKFSATNHFFRTPVGQLLFAFLTGAAGCVSHAVQTHGLQKAAVAYAVLGFAASFFATSSTDKPGDGDVLKIVLFLLLPATMNGCAFGRCELNHLPQTLQSVVVEVVAVASQPSNYVEDLASLARQLAPGQVDCVAEAIVDAVKKPGAVRATAAVVQHLREYLDAQKALGAKVACEGAPRRAAEREVSSFNGS